ncbi:MAG TPA: hypothetical protein VJO53_05370 [Candidatus Acidoferrales bacterium]|nr:hypothetical protein [Candidatus Acidoferrales bacterium]
MAQPKPVTEITRSISKNEAIKVLATHGVDLTIATGCAKNLTDLTEALDYDASDEVLHGAVKKLLIVNSLINMQTEHGSDDLNSSIAFGLAAIVRSTAEDIHEFLARARREEKQ